jgi:hypothetical protein
MSEREEWGGIDAHAHLSVLLIAPVQHIGRRLEGKVAHRILIDDGGWGHVGFALRRGRGMLRIKV